MVKLEQAELNEELKGAGGERIVKDDKGILSFTLRDVLLSAANQSEEGDKINDTMRLYRLQEKLSLNGGTLIELDQTDLDDLSKRGHTRWKSNPWMFGKLNSVLTRDDSVAVLKESTLKTGNQITQGM